MSKVLSAQTAIRQHQVYGLVLAGGKAARLGDISDETRNRTACPKPLAQVLTGRAIDYSLLALAQMGLKDVFVLTTSKLASALENQATTPPASVERVIMWQENRPMGTARAVDNFIRRMIVRDRDPDQLGNLTVLIMGCDNPNNFGSRNPEDNELLKLVGDHLDNCAGTTLGVSRISHHSPEWQARTFPTVVTEGLSTIRSGEESPTVLEARQDQYYRANVGASRRISFFCEPEEQKGREAHLSNFISTGCYAINVDFWLNAISPNLNSSFNDFGYHLFPSMTLAYTDHTPPPALLDPEPKRAMEAVGRSMGTAAFNAYFLPESRDGAPLFWYDVGTPSLLLHANQKGLAGEFGNPLHFGRKWTGCHLGLVGEGSLITDPQCLQTSVNFSGGAKPIHNIIGRNCRIGTSVTLTNCVIGDNVHIDNAQLHNVVVLPGKEDAPADISKLQLRNGIVAGDSLPGKQICEIVAEGAIVFRNPDGDLVVSKLVK